MAQIEGTYVGSSATLSPVLRRISVLAIVSIQVALFGSLITWRVVEWNKSGWAGMAYQIDTEVETEYPQASFFLRGRSRRVEVLVPGSPAQSAGITVGDVVDSVDGIPVADVAGLQELAGRLRAGDEITYRLARDGVPFAADVRLEPPYRLPMVITATATSVTLGAVFLIISMLVYWSRSRSQVALVFFLMCAFGAAEYLMWAVVEFDLPGLRGVAPAVFEPVAYLGLLVVGFFGVALIATLLHLSLIFPRPRPLAERWPQVLVWLYIAPFVMIVAALSQAAVVLALRTPWGTVAAAAAVAAGLTPLALRMRRLAADGGWLRAASAHPRTSLGLIVLAAAAVTFPVRLLPRRLAQIEMGIVFGLAMVVCFASLLVYSAFIVVNLYRSYRDSGVDEERQLRWPLWGTLTAVGSAAVLMVLSVVMSLVFGEWGQLDFTTGAVLSAVSKAIYLLIPISFAFGIVKYRLMDIDLIIKKTVVYSGVTGFVLVVYLVLAGVSGLALVKSAGVQSQAATVVATLTVVALFVPVRNRIQRLVDRLFFRREQDSAASIRRVTETVMQAPSVEAIALGVAEEVQRVLRCRTVAVLVRPPGRDVANVQATVGLADTAVAGLSLPVSGSILEGDATHVRLDAGELPGAERGLAERTAGVRAVVCRGGAEPVGLLVVGSKLSREPYDDADEVFLEAVAGQLAVGVGRLHGRRVELELEQALQIQRSLLPEEIPQIDGFEVAARWQPAREVSGDYFDVLRLSDDRLALCIGDVVGKGMPAALLMSSLQASVKAVATAGSEPAAVCAQVRSVVTSNLTGGRFVTFFFGVIDGADHRLRYTNCGHNPPVLVRADGTVHRLSEGGPAFARLMRGLGYLQGEAEFAPGDRMVLFTDGVSEAADGAGEQLGEERVEKLIVDHRGESAAVMEHTITDAVLAHTDGVLQDDLTLVVVAVE